MKKQTMICPRCGKVKFAYTEEDIKRIDNGMFILCPWCEAAISISKEDNQPTKTWSSDSFWS